MSKRVLLGATCAALASLSCAGNPIPSPIENEIVCTDFEVGAAHTKMEGSLKHPVRLRILDGKAVIMKMILPGLRDAATTPARSLIADDNDSYTLEWAQCENERAPKPARGGAKDKESRDVTHYECGEATVYKTDTLTTKKHDAPSHKIQFAPPPEAVCWTTALFSGDAPAPAPTAMPTASASAMPVEAPTATPSASAAPSASATPSASAAPKK